MATKSLSQTKGLRRKPNRVSRQKALMQRVASKSLDREKRFEQLLALVPAGSLM